MRRNKVAPPGLCLLALPASAGELPGDVQAYVDRRATYNYWPSEPRTNKTRRAEIERHTRNLHCDTLHREQVILEVRYRKDPLLVQAIRDAENALPD
jgi:hypothetical protein